MFVKIPDCEPEIWTKEMIQELSVQQVKDLMWFCDTIRKMSVVANMHESYEADAYCLAVQMKLKDY